MHVLAGHDAPSRVGLDLFEAGSAVQRALVTLLQTRFPDVVGAFVIARLIALLYALEVAVVDAADVTHHVRSDLSEGILAEESALDIHPRKAVTVDRDLGDFLVGEAIADRQGVASLAFVPQTLEAPAVLGLDVDDGRELVDRALEIRDLAEGELQRICGVVAGEDHAVAVKDEPAVGRIRHDRNAVVLGLGVVVLVLDHLQVEKAPEQYRECGEHNDSGDAQAQLEVIQVALGVPDLGETHESSDRPVLVHALGPALRQQKQKAHGRPQGRGNEGPREIRQSREDPARHEPHGEH